MKTKDVLKKCNHYVDTFGNDLANAGHLKTQKDCLNALQSHQEWLRMAVDEECKAIDNLIKELGLIK